MSFDPHSRRFDPRWLFPAIETDGEETSEAPDVSPFSWDEESTDDPAGRDYRRGTRADRVGKVLCVSPLRGNRGEGWIRAELRSIPPDLVPNRLPAPDPPAGLNHRSAIA